MEPAITSPSQCLEDAVDLVQKLIELQEDSEKGGTELLQPLEWDELKVFAVASTAGHPLRSVVGLDKPFFFVCSNDADHNAKNKDVDVESKKSPIPATATTLKHSLQTPEIKALCSTLSLLPNGTPTSTDDAQYLLSLYSMGSQKHCQDVSTLWPIFVACKDEQQSTILGMWRKQSQVVSFKVPLMSRSTVPKPKATHLRGLTSEYMRKWSLPAEAKVNTKASAIYNIIGSPDCLDMSNISVYFSWDSPTSLCGPPPFSAQAFLRARAIPGTGSSSAAWLNSDLTMLNTLLKYATTLAENSDADPSEVWQEQRTNDDLDVDTFIDGIKHGTAKPQVTTKSTQRNGISQRTDLDFTDSLWEFSKRANGFTALRSALARVFSALQQGVLQPMIHKTNNSKIANIARACLRSHSGSVPNTPQSVREMMQDFAVPHKLLDAVIEIAANKLRRDFKSFFVGEEIANEAQLKFYFEHDTSSANQVTRLHALRNVLEIYTLTKSYVDISHSDLRQLTTDGLEYYKHQPHDSLPFFELTLAEFSEGASKLKRTCGSMDPARWNVSFSSDVEASKMIAMYSNTQECFGISKEESSNHDILLGLGGDVNATTYHSTVSEARVITVG